ncbi:MAG TPA: MgtC/SapB family protein [Candidatus Eisenbacteria bacterium]|nr:MgtC/SapB family protein [Candidatus Eisenbacteria bacterium]
MTFGWEEARAIGVAALGGAAIGVERQWSGHAAGPSARIGGVRTFTLLGILGGLAGWLWIEGAPTLAAALLLAGGALVVAGYAAVSRRDPDGTTEVAALVVLASGTAAGAGQLQFASAIVALTALLLIEKSRLHRAVAKIDDAELRAAVRFAVMAIVILPLLPEGPFGPWGGVRPRELWLWVLLFSGLSFLGFILRRVVGAGRGDLVAGLLGGAVSSTSVTFTFARASREHPARSRPLASGVLAACAVMIVRVMVAAAILNPRLAWTLVPYLSPPFAVLALGTIGGLRRHEKPDGAIEGPANPLEIWPALQMTAIFQVVLFVVHEVGLAYGGLGLAVSGAILGLTDLDALTLSMARSAAEPDALRGAGLAIAIGVISNSLLKAGVAWFAGRGAMRALVPGVLAASAAAALGAILWFR